MSKPAAAPDPAATQNEQPKKKGGASKLLIGAFVSAVIVAETAIFFLMVPSGEDVAALAESKLIKKVQAEEKEHHESEDDKLKEFDLGIFSQFFQPPGETRKYRVEFKLTALVLAKDDDQMSSLLTDFKGRLRDRINKEIRNAPLSELNENQLGLIQRRLLATSTELLGVPIIVSLAFPDYQVTED